MQAWLMTLAHRAARAGEKQAARFLDNARHHHRRRRGDRHGRDRRRRQVDDPRADRRAWHQRLDRVAGKQRQGGVSAGFGNVNTLLDSDAKAMARELPSVAFVSPVLAPAGSSGRGKLNWGTLAQGVAPEFQQIRDWQVAEGRFLHEGDMDSAAKVAVHRPNRGAPTCSATTIPSTR